MTRILGIDPSLTATGLALYESRGGNWTKPLVVRTKLKGHPRIDHIRGAVAAYTEQLQAEDLVVMEDPALHGISANFHQLAGLWWIIRHDLYFLEELRGIVVATVNPKSRALYLTENGNADKSTVLAHARAAWPKVEIVDDNAADAMILAAMGARYLGTPIDHAGPRGLASHGKVNWP